MLKGLLLMLTCSSHFMERPPMIDKILEYVPTYYVPMFFVISGYLCKPLAPEMDYLGGVKLLIKKRTKTLLIPYFFFSFLALLHEIKGDFEGSLIQLFYTGSACGIATPMWFVSGLFMVSIVFTPVIYSKRLNGKYILLLVICFLWVLRYMLKDLPITLPWHLNGLPTLGILFLSGYWYRHYGRTIQNNLIGAAMGIMFLAIGCVGFFIPIKGTLLSVICPLFLTLSICLLCSMRNIQLDLKFLRWFSINGIVILGLHNFCYRYYHVLVKHIDVIANNDWIFFFASFVLVFATLFLVLVPAMNTYGYKVIGKERQSWVESYHI